MMSTAQNTTGIDGTVNVSSREACFYLVDPLNTLNKFLFIETVITTTINFLCSFVATIGNGILIVTFWKTIHLRSQSHLFLWCLAFADFITGFIVQPAYGVHKIAYILGHSRLSCIFRVIMETVAWISAAVSCTIFAAIAGERYMALYYHLRYNEVVTTRKITIVIVYLWVSITALSLSRFATHEPLPFLFVNIFGIFLSLFTLLVAYWKIYQLVRHHHRQIQDQRAITSGQNSSLDLKRYKRSAMDMAIIAVVYSMVYVPFTCVLFAYLAFGFTSNVEAAYDITRTLTFLTSSWNPFLYCWKLADLRGAVRNVLGRNSNATEITAMEMSAPRTRAFRNANVVSSTS